MKRRAGMISLALTALAVLGLAHPCPVGAQQPPALNLVPFKITQAPATTARITIPGNPPVQAVTATTSGQSDLFGAVTIVTAHTNHLSVDGLPFRTTDGFGVVNGANGDGFFLTYSGLLHATDQPGVFTFELAYNITGGTGRFTGATGSGTTTGVTDIPNKKATVTMVGMITAPKP